MICKMKQWTSCFIILMLLDIAVFACETNDSPVNRREQDRSTPPIQEGIVGRVSTSDGDFVKGAFMQPKSLDHPAQPIPEIAILSDDEGKYAWPLLPGNYEISVSVKGCQRAVRHTVIETGQVVEVDFILQCQTD